MNACTAHPQPASAGGSIAATRVLPVRHPVAIGGAVVALGLRKWHWKGGYEVGEHLPVRFYRDSTGGG